MYYILRFSRLCPSTSTALRQWETSIILFSYQFEFCTRNHSLTFSITMSSVPHFFPWMTSWQSPKRCNSEGARTGLCGGWGRTVHLSVVIVSCVFKLVCCCGLSCWKRISASFLWDWTLLKCFCKVLKVWMYRFELVVWSHCVMLTEVTSCASHKTVAMTFPAEGVSLNFLFQEVGWCHFFVRNKNCRYFDFDFDWSEGVAKLFRQPLYICIQVCLKMFIMRKRKCAL